MDKAERVRIARDLIAASRLDVSAALTLLNTLPHSLDASTSNVVDHAKRAVAATPGGDHRHQAIARYLLARVLVFLERIEPTTESL